MQDNDNKFLMTKQIIKIYFLLIFKQTEIMLQINSVRKKQFNLTL